MSLIRIPPALSAGDKIALISPSGIIEPACVEGAAALLRKWGLCPEVLPHALSMNGRYAGSVEQRFSDLKQALTDPDIKAILCNRGGYGAVHLLPFLPDDLWSASPKWLIGFSDITLLLSAFLRAGVASVHAPMSRHMSEEGEDDEGLDYLRRLLFGESLAWTLPGHCLNRSGKGAGRLVGGNLAVFCGLRGTGYDYDYTGKILFIEDVGERPYQIERMMYNLKLGGVLKNLSGLLVGRFTGYEEDLSLGKTVYEMIAGLVDEYDYPVCFDFPVGHVKRNYPLLVGGYYHFEVGSENITFSEIR